MADSRKRKKLDKICFCNAVGLTFSNKYAAFFMQLFIFLQGIHSSMEYAPPVIDISGDIDVFFDSLYDTSSDKWTNHRSIPKSRHFRYLTADPLNDEYIYVGAIDHVYRLNAASVSKNHIKSANLSMVALDKVRENLVNCLARGKDPFVNKPNNNRYMDVSLPGYRAAGYLMGIFGPSYPRKIRMKEFSCQNHVRAVLRVSDDKLFVCSTGIDSPIVYHLTSSTLDVLTVDPKGGRAKCPYDPASNYTIVYVEKGNPLNIPSIYTGTVTDFSNSDPVIFRPTLIGQHSREYRLLRTEQDSRWLADPHFVGSYDIGQYVYYFFRELAIEQGNCRRVVVSRVARVCKSDEGGTSLSMDYRWTTFLKARLNCSVPGVDQPFYFDEIYDVQFNRTEEAFYGLFRTIQGGYWGSAVCRYSLSSIEQVFNESPFKSQQSFEAGWFPANERDVPVPRPGNCEARSTDLSTSTLLFIKSHPLLHQMVDAEYGRPIYHTKQDLAFTRLAVHRPNPSHTVLFLSSTRGYIHKVSHWLTDSGRSEFNTLSVLRIKHVHEQPIHQLLLHAISSTQSTYLYIATDDVITQMSINMCHQYKMCHTCSRDPYCGWDAQLNVCRTYRPGLLQSVKASGDHVCSKLCSTTSKHYTTSRELLQGVPIHLNCTSLCLSPESLSSSSSSSSSSSLPYSEVKVVWHFSDSRTAHMVRIDNTETFITLDNSLVILSAHARHHGNFTCSVNGYVTARHEVKLLPCRYGADKEETWREEFTRWCNSYTQYTREYNQWLCLKKQCIKEQCVPQSVINRCTQEGLSTHLP